MGVIPVHSIYIQGTMVCFISVDILQPVWKHKVSFMSVHYPVMLLSPEHSENDIFMGIHSIAL